MKQHQASLSHGRLVSTPGTGVAPQLQDELALLPAGFSVVLRVSRPPRWDLG